MDDKVLNRIFEPINCWLVVDRLAQPLVVLNPLKFLALLTHGKFSHSRINLGHQGLNTDSTHHSIGTDRESFSNDNDVDRHA